MKTLEQLEKELEEAIKENNGFTARDMIHANTGFADSCRRVRRLDHQVKEARKQPQK